MFISSILFSSTVDMVCGIILLQLAIGGLAVVYRKFGGGLRFRNISDKSKLKADAMPSRKSHAAE
jgi:hypothetical protein